MAISLERDATIKNLDAAERGYKLESGELVAMRASRLRVLERGAIVMRVGARMVDAEGATLMVGGQPVAAESSTATVYMTPDQQAPDLEAILDRQAARAAERALAIRKALELWAALPADEAETVEKAG